MILADENIDKDVVGAIRKIGLDVLLIRYFYSQKKEIGDPDFRI